MNLNDKKAIAKACGHGFTQVGWDNAGCGSSSCVSVASLLLRRQT